MKTIVKAFLNLLTALMLAGYAFPCPAQTAQAATRHRVGSAQELSQLLSALAPGDTVYIRNGTYRDWVTVLPATLKGTASMPVVIRPQSPGQVVFQGDSRFEFRGAYVQLQDVTFDATQRDSVLFFGNHNRLTGSHFRNAGDPHNTQAGIITIRLGASYNQIDRCEFVGNLSMGIKVRVPTSREPGPAAVHNRIRHNRFRDIVARSSNGQEAVQLGVGGETERGYPRTRVEHNTFLRVSGDREVISNKSSGNIIRYNRIEESHAELTLRGGHDCLVEGNVLIKTYYGIRIMGSGHRVLNNFIKDPTSGYGILVSHGSAHYTPAQNNLIAHNTIIAGKAGIRITEQEPQITRPAVENRFLHNILINSGSKSALFLFSAAYPESSFCASNVISNNLLWWRQSKPGPVPRAPAGSVPNFAADPELTVNNQGLPQISVSSPAVNRVAEPVVSGDILGRRRPAAEHDLGAFEAVR